MNTPTCAPSPWGGLPFDSTSDRLLWEAGFPSEFDTFAEAEAAIAEMQQLPQFAQSIFRTRLA